MEGRDIGTNVFPETDYKFYLDAHLDERTKRRAAEGVNENLAARTSATASAPPRPDDCPRRACHQQLRDDLRANERVIIADIQKRLGTK